MWRGLGVGSSIQWSYPKSPSLSSLRFSTVTFTSISHLFPPQSGWLNGLQLGISLPSSGRWGKAGTGSFPSLRLGFDKTQPDSPGYVVSLEGQPCENNSCPGRILKGSFSLPPPEVQGEFSQPPRELRRAPGAKTRKSLEALLPPSGGWASQEFLRLRLVYTEPPAMSHLKFPPPAEVPAPWVSAGKLPLPVFSCFLLSSLGGKHLTLCSHLPTVLRRTFDFAVLNILPVASWEWWLLSSLHAGLETESLIASLFK